MEKQPNNLVETLKASLFLDFNKNSFQLNQRLEDYIPMWIWAGILLLTLGFAYLPYLAILFGIFYFLLKDKIEDFEPLNLMRNLTYSFATTIIYFLILFGLKVGWIFLLETLNMYGGWDILGDFLISIFWLIVSQTIWYILMSIHTNFKYSKIRVLLSQIFIILSTLGLFLISFLITGGFF